MSQTRIINRPGDRHEHELAPPEDEHNLTIASAMESKFGSRKEFGAWMDGVNAKLAPKGKRRGRR